MTFEDHNLFSHSLKTALAESPRAPGSVVLDNFSNYPSDYVLKVCYRKYIIKKEQTGKLINFIFLHGNGMNKGIWHYHITRLYEAYYNDKQFSIGTVLAIDSVNHGHSAELNREKIGDVFDWNDGAKDVIKVVKDYEFDTFGAPDAINILIGHSMGGFIASRACYLEPNLFDGSILINPVFVTKEEYLEGVKYMIYKTMNAGIMVDSIPVSGDWRKAAYDHYRKKSFWKKFDDKVLRHMLEDDLSTKLKSTPLAEVSTINFNTSAFVQAICYLNSFKSGTYSIPTFPLIKTPTYYVSSSDDYADEDSLKVTRDTMGNAIPINLNEGSHLVLGERPDLVVDTILDTTNVLVGSLKEHGEARYFDRKLLDKDGKHYRERVKGQVYQSLSIQSKM